MGGPADREYPGKSREDARSLRPGRGDTYIEDSVGILFRAFHADQGVTERGASRTSRLPVTVLTWDGRLDNREELSRSIPGLFIRRL